MGVIQSFWDKLFGSKKVIRDSGWNWKNYFESGGFGHDISKSSLVHASIHAIAEEASKMIIKSVIKRQTENGTVYQTNNDDLNRLFSRRPNPLQTLKDLLYWSAYRLETKSNFYWYPEKIYTTYANGDVVTKIISIFPINSVSEAMYFDSNENRYYMKFQMETGSEYVIPYNDLIHIRKHYGKDFYVGSRNRTELLKTLNVIQEVNELIPKAVKASIQIKGILTAKSNADLVGLKKFKEEFESSLKSSDTSLGVLDVAGDFKPVQIDPKVIDKDTLNYLDNVILNEFGVDISIIRGNATENTWSSLYQKHIEPLKIALEQAMQSVLFTENEFNHGNRIKIYDKLVNYYTISTRLSIVKELGPRGYLTRAEQRELIGYEPDGGPEQVSLNYTQTDDQKEYQLGKKEEKQEEDDVNQT